MVNRGIVSIDGRSTRRSPPLPSELPVVPLRGSVVLPMTVAPLGVSRPMSVEAINRALAGDRMVLLLLQKNDADEPGTRRSAPRRHRRDRSGRWPRRRTACACWSKGSRGSRAEFLQTDKGFMRALLKPLPEVSERSIEIDAHVRHLQELVDRALSLATGLSPDIKALVTTLDDPLRVVYLLASLLDMKAGGQAEAARRGQPDRQARRRAPGALARDRGARAQGTDRVARREGDDRRAAAVHAAPAAEGDPDASSAKGTANRRSCASGSTRRSCRSTSPTVANREVDRLERMTPASPEYQMIRTYLDWLLDVPWDKADRRSPRSDRGAPRARRGSLRPRQGQGTHRRVPRGPQAQGGPEGADPLLRRPARRRQDVARAVDRARDEPEVRAHLARRRARRSGDPRPPAHLHRLDARAGSCRR